MTDIGWRPTPCPTCGHMREAEEHPKCRNPNCLADKEEPVSVPDRRVTSYKALDGSRHDTFEAAVATDLLNLFDQKAPDGHIDLNIMVSALVKQPLRSQVIALLKELG